MGVIRNIEKFIWNSKKHIVQENTKFKNIHKGETCLIFGNGGSLKFYDFSALPSLPKIGCSYSLADNRIEELGLDYCIISDTYLLYPLRLHSYEKKIQRNYIAPILRKIIRTNSQTRFFTSLTNYFSYFNQPSNLNYFHHFGDRTSLNYDLSGSFAVGQGALSLMLGLAKYMGFAKAIILGCDYLGSPKLEGHFYADAAPIKGADDRGYCEQIKKTAEGIDILCIFPSKIRSLDFPSKSYQDEFKSSDKYQENYEIIDPIYLSMMRKGIPGKQIWM